MQLPFRSRLFSRRQVLATGVSAIGVASVPAVAFADTQTLAPTKSWPLDPIAPVDASSTITIADKYELGERLIVTGVVTGPDGKTPLRGASIYVFHTDAKGRYDPTLPNSEGEKNPRLWGLMRTDAKGQYAYTTIRPAPYSPPGPWAPGHVHYKVVAPGYEETHSAAMYFSDESDLGKAFRPGTRLPGQIMRPDFHGVCRPTRDAKATWHARMDIVLSLL